MMANKIKDDGVREEIIKLLDKSKVNSGLKKNITDLIKEMENGELDNLFDELKKILKEDNNSN